MRASNNMKRRSDAALLYLIISLLAGLLAACGGEGQVTPTPAASSPTAGPSSAVSTAAAIVTPETTTAIAGGAAPSFTNEPSFTPAGLPTPAASPTAGVRTVMNSGLKSDLVIWDGLPERLAGLVKDQTAAFGKAYPGVKITSLHFDPHELVYAVEDAVKDSNLPDLIVASADYLADFKPLNALQPAGPVLEAAFLNGYAANALNGSRLDGVQWGVPFTYSGTPLMLYNKKLVPTAPATWDELGQVVRPLYDQKTRQIGLAADINEPYLLNSLLGAYNGSLLDNSNRPTLNTPAMVSALTFLQELERNRTVRAESRLKDNQLDYAFRDGRLGVYIAGDWLIGDYAGAINPASDAKLDLGVAPLPRLEKNGQAPVPFSNSRTIFIGRSAGGDRLKAARAFIEWTARPEQQAAILDKGRLLPATKAFLAGDAVKSNPVWSGLLAQLEQGRPQPPVLEMRAVWDAVRPELEGAVAGVLRPAEAARRMQQTALANVAKLAAG